MLLFLTWHVHITIAYWTVNGRTCLPRQGATLFPLENNAISPQIPGGPKGTIVQGDGQRREDAFVPPSAFGTWAAPWGLMGGGSAHIPRSIALKPPHRTRNLYISTRRSTLETILNFPWQFSFFHFFAFLLSLGREKISRSLKESLLVFRQLKTLELCRFCVHALDYLLRRQWYFANKSWRYAAVFVLHKIGIWRLLLQPNTRFVEGEMLYSPVGMLARKGSVGMCPYKAVNYWNVLSTDPPALSVFMKFWNER